MATPYAQYLDVVAEVANDEDGVFSAWAGYDFVNEVLLQLLHPEDGSAALLTEDQLLAAAKRVTL